MMIPELPELPEIQEHSLRALNLRRDLVTRLPAMNNGSPAELFGYSARAQEAARYAEAMRIAFEITRRQKMIENAKKYLL